MKYFIFISLSGSLRDRPGEGGIIERPFKTFNTEFFSTEVDEDKEVIPATKEIPRVEVLDYEDLIDDYGF